jgi:hypothetical protein
MFIYQEAERELFLGRPKLLREFKKKFILFYIKRRA